MGVVNDQPGTHKRAGCAWRESWALTDSLPNSSGRERNTGKEIKRQVWWNKPVLPALMGLSQKFKASQCDSELKA